MAELRTRLDAQQDTLEQQFIAIHSYQNRLIRTSHSLQVAELRTRLDAQQDTLEQVQRQLQQQQQLIGSPSQQSKAWCVTLP